jgi:hypothetical protein
VYIIKSDDIYEAPMAKTDPATVEFETRAKNLLKAELKRRGITYAGLALRMSAISTTRSVAADSRLHSCCNA